MTQAQADKLSFTINLSFPLDDGRTLVQGPLTYQTDGLYTNHSCDFLQDPRFQEAYQLGAHTGHKFREKEDDLHIEWRAHVLLWAASQARRLPGDFVECGVNTGIYSRAIMHYLSFEKMTDRKFYLLDTFNGIPEEQLTEGEKAVGMQHMNRRYFDCHELVKKNFADYPNAVIIKGKIPETLEQVTTDKVCYLSIDMNAQVPEIAAMEYFWDRLVPGAMVVLDDYGFPNHVNQKRAFDDFARRYNVDILSVPTGQGMLIKS
jgi:hypothetical protein